MLSLLFIASFIAGIVFSVFMMLTGVVKPPAGSNPEVPTGSGPFISRDRLEAAYGELSARFNIPILAALGTSFGLIGYALSRFTQLGAVAQLAIAGVAGGGVAVLVATMITRWALPAAKRDIPDERYVLQGHFAMVVVAVTASAAGLVSLEINGVHHTAPAISVQNDFIDAGTEVVIERMENDVAFVEPWSAVERRL